MGRRSLWGEFLTGGIINDESDSVSACTVAHSTCYVGVSWHSRCLPVTGQRRQDRCLVQVKPEGPLRRVLVPWDFGHSIGPKIALLGLRSELDDSLIINALVMDQETRCKTDAT